MKIEDLDDVKAWIAEHDGRIDAYWLHQHQFNERSEMRLESLHSRVSSVERKVIWLSSIAAMIGALLGSLLPHIVGIILGG